MIRYCKKAIVHGTSWLYQKILDAKAELEYRQTANLIQYFVTEGASKDIDDIPRMIMGRLTTKKQKEIFTDKNEKIFTIAYAPFLTNHQLTGKNYYINPAIYNLPIKRRD